MDLARLTDELDARLADADAALAREFPGERPGRQPVHTVYVPADRFHAGLAGEYGAAALDAVATHEPILLALLQGDGLLLDRVRDKLDREPVEDLRIDFEDGYGPRPDDVEDDAARAAAGALRTAVEDGTAAAVPRHPLQELRARDPAPRPAHAGALPRGPDRRRTAARRLRRHPAQGHVRRPGRGPGAGLRAARGRARPRAGLPALRDPGRDAPVDPRPRRHRPGRPDDPRLRRPVHGPALRHLRLQRRLRHRGRPPEPRPPGRRPRQGGHAGRRGGHRRPALRRLHQRPPGRRRPTTSVPPGTSTCGWSAARCSAATTRAGTCTRPSCPPGTPRPSPSTATGSRRRRAGCATTPPGRTSGVLDEPATARALADFLLARPRLRRPRRPTT